MDATALHHRARTSGVNPVLYWIVRAVLQPFFRLWFRLGRFGCEHIPAEGPVLIAANHRSFLDPFVIATMTRRPMYYVAKKELFARRWQGWLLNALGAFPVDRGSSDQEMLITARAILERGDCVLIFPEGTRIRPGGLGTPKRGVGRLALESGAPIVPVAVVGTDDIRRGWRIRPHRVSTRAGRPLTFPTVERPSKQLAQAVTDRIWPCVALQWEWLGGLAPLRRAAVVGSDARAATLTATLRSAGLDVEMAAPGTPDLALERADLVVLAVADAELPCVIAAHGDRVAPDAGVLLACDARETVLGEPRARFVTDRVAARAVAELTGPEEDLACADRDFAAQLRRVLATEPPAPTRAGRRHAAAA